jgi:16S rRNA (cytosine967-C5)-methyltransferase
MPKQVKPAATRISPAREAAFQILREIAGSSQTHSDELLQSPKVDALSSQDRNLCTTLVMGVLRWQLALDAQSAKLLTHKSKMDEPVRIALRLGIFQLLMLDRIPVHAAISDSVELTKRAGHRFASGLVNAVLRKVAAQAPVLKQELSAEAAHPAWLLDRWRISFGASVSAVCEGASVSAVCEYDQQPPLTTLRLVDTDDFQKDGTLLAPGAFLTSARQVLSGNLPANETAIRLQDEGSQLVAELLGGGTHGQQSILDCCAAPGGKTAILAERNPDAKVAACDISAKRLAAMRERFESSPTLRRIEFRNIDVIEMPVSEHFDLILCDVPCSGTGTLARNPEIKLRLRQEDLVRQQERQIAILSAALRHLAPGGRLLYSTCSLEPEENEDVVGRVLSDRRDVSVIPIAGRIEELQAAGIVHEEGAAHLLANAVSGDYLRTMPGVSPCDGFFAALLTVSP